MIIQCDQCNAKFKIDDAKVPEKGAMVRCKKCQHIFKIERPQEIPFPPLTSEKKEEELRMELPSEPQEPTPSSEAEQEGFWGDESFAQEKEPSLEGEEREGEIFGEMTEGLEEERGREEGFETDFKIPEEAEKEAGKEDEAFEESFQEESITEQESLPEVVPDMEAKPSFFRRPLTLTLLFLIVIVIGLYLTQGSQLGSLIQGLSGKETIKGKGALGLSGLKGYYKENSRAGRIFVVEGKIVNPWNFSIMSKGVRGSVFDRNGKKVQDKFVPPNTIFTPKELMEHSAEDVEKVLMKQPEETLLGPGNALPFMIVFFNVPNDLAEFEVEVSE